MKRKPYRYFLYLLLRFLHVIILILPYRVVVFLGGFFGTLAYSVLPKYRNITLENLRGVFRPEKSDKEIKQIARGVFSNLGKTSMECLSLPKLSKKKVLALIEDKGTANIKKGLSHGKGIIALGAHLGNWEMCAAYMVAQGFDMTVIAKRIYYPPYNKILVSLRDSVNVKTLYRDDKKIIRKCLEVLKSNKTLAIVPDQDVDSIKGVFVDFFGKKAYTPAGPVTLALLSGAPIVPVFLVREGGRFYCLTDEPIHVKSSGDKDKDILTYTKKWSSVVEEYIRRYPSQWVWMHKRWKTEA